MKLLTSAFIALNVWLYRVSGGRMMGRMGAAPILLLTTTGTRNKTRWAKTRHAEPQNDFSR